MVSPPDIDPTVLDAARRALLRYATDAAAVELLAVPIAAQLGVTPRGVAWLDGDGRPRHGRHGRQLDARDCVVAFRDAAARDGDHLTTALFREG